MTTSDEVTLRDFFTDTIQAFQRHICTRFEAMERNTELRFTHIDEKIETVRKDVERLEKKMDDQQKIHLSCLERQKHEQADIWASINATGKKQEHSDGFREGEHHAKERFDWTTYIQWARMGALAAWIVAAITIVIRFV